jgi:hypothetical protein
MAMSKQDFIALADAIREHNELQEGTVNPITFGPFHLNTLANFCQSQNPRFMRERWFGYIRGENGKNGGAIRHKSPTGHYYREA